MIRLKPKSLQIPFRKSSLHQSHLHQKHRRKKEKRVKSNRQQKILPHPILLLFQFLLHPSLPQNLPLQQLCLPLLNHHSQHQMKVRKSRNERSRECSSSLRSSQQKRRMSPSCKPSTTCFTNHAEVEESNWV
ncbi:hypothetical protein BLNAU_15315 [Blattamonas nauphoetae]|uniref:Uncharacterized protein n=1 Tax=Blattamonas nauphoetae TaxID=2049346 RepID=A0ABQ9XCS6_9EUKA|nr:hypothetical protein BLNAU_15315 [Blattamonas nauphoetae]